MSGTSVHSAIKNKSMIILLVVGAFHVDGSGRILVRSDADGMLHSFDMASTKPILSKKVTKFPLRCVRIANQKRIIAIAASDS